MRLKDRTYSTEPDTSRSQKATFDTKKLISLQWSLLSVLNSNVFSSVIVVKMAISPGWVIAAILSPLGSKQRPVTVSEIFSIRRVIRWWSTRDRFLFLEKCHLDFFIIFQLLQSKRWHVVWSSMHWAATRFVRELVPISTISIMVLLVSKRSN